MEVKEEGVYLEDKKTSTKIDFSDVLDGLNKSQQREVLDQVGELLVTQVLEYVANSKSPIDGSTFHALSDEYAKKKKEETGSDDPNLDLTGKMLSSLDYKIIGQAIELGVYGDDAGKADGHNNFSGKSKLPERKFLPDKGELFDDEIVNIINDAIDMYKADNLSLDEDVLKNIDTKEELYGYLANEFDWLSKPKIKELILSSELATTLDKFDLLDLL